LKTTGSLIPLRIGADSQGNNGFVGRIREPVVFNRALSTEEIQKLANGQLPDPLKIPGCVVALDLSEAIGHGVKNLAQPKLPAKIVGKVKFEKASEGAGCLRLSGEGYLEIAHHKSLDGLDGATLAAWIWPDKSAPGGMRIIDKSPVGTAAGYLLDTYPDNSLRLITREPHLIYKANLAAEKWTHVAATVDGETGRQSLYIDGKKVMESEK
jgi:hypothetical protein